MDETPPDVRPHVLLESCRIIAFDKPGFKLETQRFCLEFTQSGKRFHILADPVSF